MDFSKLKKAFLFGEEEKSSEDEESDDSTNSKDWDSDAFLSDFENFKLHDETLFICPICYNSIKKDEMVTFGCGHLSCKECLKLILMNIYNSGQWGFVIQCFNGNCSQTTDFFCSLPILISLLGRKKVDNMCDQADREISTNQCANCLKTILVAESNVFTIFNVMNVRHGLVLNAAN